MKLPFLFAFLVLIASCGNNPNPKTPSAGPASAAEVKEPAAPFVLPVPEGWTTEHFPIPIEFAPQIPYKGVEELRFTPGWGDTASDQHWSYFFLWWLENNPTPDAAQLQQYLTDYYNGLVGRNIDKRKIPAEKLVTTKAVITEDTTAAAGDLHTYTGTIQMLNYLKQEPIILHCRIHDRKCADNHTALLFEISPQGSTHPVWEAFSKIVSGFDCGR